MSKFNPASAGNFELEKALEELSSQGNGIPVTTGNVYYVIPSTDGNYDEFINKYQKIYLDGTFAVHNTIASAYSAVTSNRHDVVMLSANAAHAQTSMLSIAKNRVHFVGFGLRFGSIGMGARARVTIGVTVAATDLAVLQNTGVGNTFDNIKFDSGNTVTEGKYGVVEAGEYAIYRGCEFYLSSQLSVTGAAEVANNGDSAQFINCTFGSSANETVGSIIRPCMLVTGGIVSGKKLRDGVIIDCIFLTKSAATNRVDIYGANATDVERMLLVKNSTFMSNALGSATPAHAVGFGAAQTQGTVLLQDCVSVDHTVMAEASVGIFVAGSVATFATTGVAKSA